MKTIRLHHYYIWILLILTPLMGWAQQQNLTKGVAVEGYDLVSYYEGKPTEGTSSNSIKYKGAVYYFKDVKNKEKFAQEPEKYLPAYGGWCAYAMGNTGEKVEINPETYKIIDGKLYLFYNKFFNNTLKDWNKDEKNLKSKADKNWQNWLRKP